MIVYAVKPRVRFADSPDVKQIQSVSFHGDSFRDVASHKWTPAFLGSNNVEPLHIIRDGRRIPDITSPSLGLVVTDRAKSTLSQFTGIDFSTAVIDRLVDFYVQDGDFTMYEERNDFDHWEKLRQAPAFISTGVSEPRIHEVLLAHHLEVCNDFTPTHTATISFSELDKPQYTTSAKFLNIYPLHFFERCFVMTQAVFASLELHLDWRFYIKQRLVLKSIA